MLAALAATPGYDTHAYYSGLLAGTLAGLPPLHQSDPRQALQLAEATFYARPVMYAPAVEIADRNRARNGMAEARADLLYACGVLLGYSLVTEDRPDAATCPMCDRRICTELDEHTTCLIDGPLCADPDHSCGHNECWEASL